ncbi:unnamed protein product [Somion occarium]|uniref:Uncharacterized protein n=1 Tax=Somion occarium TaxID=3059160 RepID=A0ABP1CSL1_9APHY
MPLAWPYEPLPNVQVSFADLVQRYEAARAALDAVPADEEDRSRDELKKFLNLVLCARTKNEDDEDIRLVLNMTQAVERPTLEDCIIMRDFDSAIGYGKTLPFTKAMAVFPVAPFSETLKKRNHVQGYVFSPTVSGGCIDVRMMDILTWMLQRVKLYVPMNKIPNFALGKVDNRHVTRVFLPALYQEGPGMMMGIGKEQLKVYYERCLLPAVREAVPEHVGHWPPSYDTAMTLARGPQGEFHFQSVDVPWHRLELLGNTLLDKLGVYAFGRDAYFVHELHGTKSRSVHDPRDEVDTFAALDDVLAFVDANVIDLEEEKWWIDVGIEIQRPRRVVQWLTMGHSAILRHVLPGLDAEEANRMMTTGDRFQVDLNSQLSEIGGFRVEVNKRYQHGTECVYINCYTTDKTVTYQLHKGIFRQRHGEELFPSKCGKLIGAMEKMEEVWTSCMGEGDSPGQEGSARLEARVPLTRCRATLTDMPQSILDSGIVAYKKNTWWGFKVYRLEALRLLVEWQNESRHEYRRDAACLTLGAIAVYMVNALSSRPRSGTAEDALLCACCRRFPTEADDEEGELVPNPHWNGLYSLSGIVLDQYWARLPHSARAAEQVLSFMYHRQDVNAIQMEFGSMAAQGGRRQPRADRTANKRAITQDIRPLANDGEVKNFRLQDRGVTLKRPRTMPGPDTHVHHLDDDSDDEVAQPGNPDVILQGIWRQFPADVLSKAPNPKNGNLPGYLRMTAENRLHATTAIFKSNNLTNVIAPVQVKLCDAEFWDVTLFNRYFPPKGAQLPRTLQNFRQCVYFKEWLNLMDKLNERNAGIVRDRVQREFHKLLWLPYGGSDRMWQTRLDSKFRQFPADGERVPCPQIGLNPAVATSMDVIIAPIEIEDEENA